MDVKSCISHLQGASGPISHFVPWSVLQGYNKRSPLQLLKAGNLDHHYFHTNEFDICSYETDRLPLPQNRDPFLNCSRYSAFIELFATVGDSHTVLFLLRIIRLGPFTAIKRHAHILLH